MERVQGRFRGKLTGGEKRIPTCMGIRRIISGVKWVPGVKMPVGVFLGAGRDFLYTSTALPESGLSDPLPTPLPPKREIE
jgi:hypothetical protein